MTTTNESKQKKRDVESAAVEESGGNVFEDLGLPDAQEALHKADLTHEICEVISKRKWTQAQAAKILGVDQPKVSALVRGKLDQFSIDRLLKFLDLLGQEVRFTIRPRKQHRRA